MIQKVGVSEIRWIRFILELYKTMNESSMFAIKQWDDDKVLSDANANKMIVAYKDACSLHHAKGAVPALLCASTSSSNFKDKSWVRG